MIPPFNVKVVPPPIVKLPEVKVKLPAVVPLKAALTLVVTPAELLIVRFVPAVRPLPVT